MADDTVTGRTFFVLCDTSCWLGDRLLGFHIELHHQLHWECGGTWCLCQDDEIMSSFNSSIYSDIIPSAWRQKEEVLPKCQYQNQEAQHLINTYHKHIKINLLLVFCNYYLKKCVTCWSFVVLWLFKLTAVGIQCTVPELCMSTTNYILLLDAYRSYWELTVTWVFCSATRESCLVKQQTHGTSSLISTEVRYPYTLL